MRMRIALMVISGVVAGIWSADAEVTSGRNLEGRRDFSVGLTAGSVFGLNGEVVETTRPIEEIGGRTSGAPPEDYSWEELGFDQDFETFGIFIEQIWKYATLRLEMFHGNPKLEGTADRDFYIGVGDVSFNGQDYEYMKIPEGTSYTGDIDLYTFLINLNITPVSFGSPDGIQFTPWLHLGLFSFVGDYEIDAGEAQGVTQYENPPRDYVIGGQASGTSGLVIPEYGVGGELRIPIGEASSLSLECNIALLNFDGSTSDFGIDSRNNKALDIDFVTASARVLFEVPMSEKADFMFGVEFQQWEADADVEAEDKSDEEVLELREKFDKKVHFEMSSIMGIVGVKF